jgi:hypothetical protein
MARVVAVHGIAQQVKGGESLATHWLPALRDGVKLAGGRRIADDEFVCAFYGDLFRKKGTKGGDVPPLSAQDVASDAERELLTLWWTEAARLDPSVPGPTAKTRVRAPQSIQRALNNLSKIPFFAGLAERALIWDLKQVVAYLNDPTMRTAIRARVSAEIGPETQVVIGHSLGSVVAYEVLCAAKASSVKSFVTLGSPLGISNVVFGKLEPAPVKGKGAWPGAEQWFNIADTGDIVALQKTLAPLFGPVGDSLVHNGSHAHDVLPYLTSVETGRAVASGLT